MTTPTREQVVQCDDVREAFERRFREPPFEFSLELYGEQDAWPGSYKKYSEQCAWDGYQEARADLEAELETERLRLAAWQPIETAPKDGSEILLCSKKGRIANGTWMTATDRVGAWLWPYIKVEPIYWMPIPAAPKEK